ncbi:MAG: signal peptidase I [Hungatella sp.]|nr:signal peptidase I [Hungatella sp.]
MEFYQVEETNTLRRVIGWIVDIAVVISLAWFVVYGYGTQVRMAGQSMTPQLLGEDVVLMDRLTYDFTDPARFDIVVFEREDHKFNVKRVIGLPGEVVQIIDNLVYINDEPLEAENGLNQVVLAGIAENPVTLGEDEYFLLGDNRDGSEDSRFVNIGNVKREQIRGKVWLRLLPLIDIGLVE